jgi:transcription elongation factor GreB
MQIDWTAQFKGIFQSMSKAFTREMDEAPEPLVKSPPSALPPGVKNYTTASGVQKLRRELLEVSAQPISASVRQRVFEIQQRLQSAVIIEPPPLPWSQVLFGATVSIRNQNSEEVVYSIVGADETDLDKNRISWLSPVAKALIKRRVGEQVRFHTPAGEQNWEITKIVYGDNFNP